MAANPEDLNPQQLGTLESFPKLEFKERHLWPVPDLPPEPEISPEERFKQEVHFYHFLENNEDVELVDHAVVNYQKETRDRRVIGGYMLVSWTAEKKVYDANPGSVFKVRRPGSWPHFTTALVTEEAKIDDDNRGPFSEEVITWLGASTIGKKKLSHIVLRDKQGNPVE